MTDEQVQALGELLRLMHEDKDTMEYQILRSIYRRHSRVNPDLVYIEGSEQSRRLMLR